MFKSKVKAERRCAWCGQEVPGSGHEAEGKLFCNVPSRPSPLSS